MIDLEVRGLGDGRFEVEALKLHHRAFEELLGAICAAYALANEAVRLGEEARVVLLSVIDWEIRLGSHGERLRRMTRT